MSDYLKELPHEDDCDRSPRMTHWEYPSARAIVTPAKPCNCRRAEALAYVEGLELENTLVAAAANAQQTLHGRIRDLEEALNLYVEYDEQTSQCPACDGCSDEDNCIHRSARKALEQT